jgi:hypothetical protein
MSRTGWTGSGKIKAAFSKFHRSISQRRYFFLNTGMDIRSKHDSTLRLYKHMSVLASSIQQTSNLVENILLPNDQASQIVAFKLFNIA